MSEEIIGLGSVEYDKRRDISQLDTVELNAVKLEVCLFGVGCFALQKLLLCKFPRIILFQN